MNITSNITSKINRKKNPVKIRKPDDEKFFKDIVLNDILGEISSETKETPNHTYKHKNTASVKKKFSAKQLFNIGIGIALLLLIIVLFTPNTETKTVVQHTPKKPAVDKQEWKMEKDRKGYKEKSPVKVVKKKTIPKKEILLKPTKIEPIPIQKTERELAKEVLRQQLLH